MAAAWRDWDVTIDIVVPTPLHPRRQRIRGYNQAAVLARPLASALGIPLAHDAIRRSRATPPLAAGEGRDARWQALDRAFAPGPGRTAIAGRRVLLIDDVATTGATLSAGAETLRAVGATGVIALVFARDGSAAPSPASPDGDR
ncbi:MAG: ComF family protein [Dehalococcoidia bacterium]|nr:ComF family protein [Dehalococcoidia bacterium]